MSRDLGLLFLRVSAGLLLFFAHGMGKASRILAGNMAFADPLGLGAAPSLLLVAFAEAVCSLLVVLGIKTRWAAVPVAINLLVAGLIHHADDPWGKQEFALIYAVPFITLIFTGGGRFALDSLFKKRR